MSNWSQTENELGDQFKKLKKEPSELSQFIWRIVVDVFNTNSNSPTDIYYKIIKDEKDVIEQIEKALAAFNSKIDN